MQVTGIATQSTLQIKQCYVIKQRVIYSNSNKGRTCPYNYFDPLLLPSVKKHRESTCHTETQILNFFVIFNSFTRMYVVPAWTAKNPLKIWKRICRNKLYWKTKRWKAFQEKKSVQRANLQTFFSSAWSSGICDAKWMIRACNIKNISRDQGVTSIQ